MKQGISNMIILAAIACFALLLGVGFALVRSPETQQAFRSILPSDAARKSDSPVSDAYDLSNRNLTSVPAQVFNETSLRELNISHNNLTGALPAEIRHMSGLRVLNASYNNMTGVPAEIGQLQNLEVLDLSHNQLTGLPRELGNLQHLRVLNLAGNRVSQQDLAFIRSELPAATQIIEN